MDTIYKRAYAKINLNLKILDKREDNYHNIESIFQRISLYDELYVSKIPEKKFELTCNIKELESESNIIFKTYEKFRKLFDLPTGISVNLIKNIPTQAGLGGGSADAAAFIFALNELFELNLGLDALELIGSKLGADVVPCMHPLCYVYGTGTTVQPLSSKQQYKLLIVKPNFVCNTKLMYEKIDIINKNNKENNIIKPKQNTPSLEEKLNNSFFANILDDIEMEMLLEELSFLGKFGPYKNNIYKKDKENDDKNEIQVKDQRTLDILTVLKTNAPISTLQGLLTNDFEQVVDQKSELLAIKKDLILHGAIAPLLTGSGSCIFGIFENEKDLDNAYNYFRKTYNYKLFKASSMN